MIVVNVIIRYDNLILLFRKKGSEEWSSLEYPLLKAETFESCAYRIVKDSTGLRFKKERFVLTDRDNLPEIQRYFYSIKVDYIPSYVELPEEFEACKWVHLHDLGCINISEELKTLFNLKR